jgi:prepilin-type N-terminal cleavage/methylation domain-containing protein
MSVHKHPSLFFSRKGFSLVEILVALCIMGMVLLPFLGFISYRIRKERDLNVRGRALEIAKIQLEQALVTSPVEDSEKMIDAQYVVRITVIKRDTYDDLIPQEIRVAVFHAQHRGPLVELCALR